MARDTLRPEGPATEPCGPPVYLDPEDWNLLIDGLHSFAGTSRVDEAVAVLGKIERQLAQGGR